MLPYAENTFPCSRTRVLTIKHTEIPGGCVSSDGHSGNRYGRILVKRVCTRVVAFIVI